ncbi:MAG TPA: alpha/beta hydrolase [Chthoniobacterales bacterium]
MSTLAGRTLASAERTLASVGRTLASVGRTLASVERTLASVGRTLASVERTLASVERTLASAERTLASVDQGFGREGVTPRKFGFGSMAFSRALVAPPGRIRRSRSISASLSETNTAQSGARHPDPINRIERITPNFRSVVLITIAVIGLVVSACTPARLARLPDLGSRPRVVMTDLTRAFEGANDQAAMRSLGTWIGKVRRNGESAGPISVGSQANGPRFSVRFRPGGPDTFAPEYFDRIEPAFRYTTEGLKHHREEGTGVPLVGFRENRNRNPIEKWYPPEGIVRAVTAVAIPGPNRDGVRQVEVCLINRLHTDSWMIAGKRQQLAADFTVPWVALLERTGPLQTTGFTSVISQYSGREAGFVLMEEYDPKRTPLVLIHGLFSTPLAWAELTNELWADPAVRRRYQIWHYLYPTHPPALYSARIMRGQLDELRRFLDPKGDDPGLQRTVIVAHSMGGLLAKTLVVDPLDAFWQAAFTRPLDALDLTADERATLQESFFWKPRSYINRIVFCSVPFRGSTVATSWVGRIGQFFAAPTSHFQDFFRTIATRNPGMLRGEYNLLASGKVSSVWGLSPRRRSMEILDGLPIIPGCATHVIMGASDPIVPQSSAILPAAESTLEVPGGHGSFHQPKAIAEIRRILLLPPAR